MNPYTAPSDPQIEHSFQQAKERYAAVGVDAEAAVERALAVPISLHCWQADDVGGFEVKEAGLDGGGIMATGNYPGRARTADEVRQDYDEAMRLLPGVQRANLHAFYLETGGKVVDRDAVALGPAAVEVDQQLGAVQRRVQRRLLKPEEEVRVRSCIHERFPEETI